MKEKLLRAIDEGSDREQELEALVVDEPADPDGRWNAKDHLAHVSQSRWRNVQTLDAVRTGGELPPARSDDPDEANAAVYAEVKDWTAAVVKADGRESWAALRKAVEQSSEADLARNHPLFPEAEVWEIVPNAVGHAGVHVWSWYLDIGDESRAMDAARWTAEVEGRFFNTPDKLANSRYNLACVYARLGRADEALPLLREAFAANPELSDLARKDHDLDRIREDLAPILL